MMCVIDGPITHNALCLPSHSGPSRRFKRICELLQSLLLSSNRGQTTTGRRISAEMTSDSSSSSYSSMDRVSPTPPDDVSLQHWDVLGKGVYWAQGCTGDRGVLGTGVYWARGCIGDRGVLGTGAYWAQGCTGKGGVLGTGV